jgi:hypothetical protein
MRRRPPRLHWHVRDAIATRTRTRTVLVREYRDFRTKVDSLQYNSDSRTTVLVLDLGIPILDLLVLVLVEV